MNKFKLLESLEDIVGQLQMGKVSFDVAVDTLDNIVTYNKKQSFMVRIDYLEGYEDTTSKHFSLNELEEFMDEDIEDMEFDVINKIIYTNTIKENWILKYHLEYHVEISTIKT